MINTSLEDKKKETHRLIRSFRSKICLLSPMISRGGVDNYSLSSFTHQAQVSSSNKDVEANDPVYSQLRHHVDENLAMTVENSSKRGSIADWIFNELRQKGDLAQKGYSNMKRDEWILLDNLVQGQGMSSATQAKALRSLSKRSKKHMSMKQLKKCGSLDLPQELHNFEIFKPMHEMWKDYIKQLLKNVGKNELAKCLLSADLQGAVILVVECKIAAFTGVNGIMIQETAETFGIITQDNKFKVVLKKISVFMLEAGSWKITLHGDKLTSRI